MSRHNVIDEICQNYQQLSLKEKSKVRMRRAQRDAKLRKRLNSLNQNSIRENHEKEGKHTFIENPSQWIPNEHIPIFNYDAVENSDSGFSTNEDSDTEEQVNVATYCPDVDIVSLLPSTTESLKKIDEFIDENITDETANQIVRCAMNAKLAGQFYDNQGHAYKKYYFKEIFLTVKQTSEMMKREYKSIVSRVNIAIDSSVLPSPYEKKKMCRVIAKRISEVEDRQIKIRYRLREEGFIMKKENLEKFQTEVEKNDILVDELFDLYKLIEKGGSPSKAKLRQFNIPIFLNQLPTSSQFDNLTRLREKLTSLTAVQECESIFKNWCNTQYESAYSNYIARCDVVGRIINRRPQREMSLTKRLKQPDVDSQFRTCLASYTRSMVFEGIIFNTGFLI